MVYQHLPPPPDRTPGGMPVPRRWPDGARPGRYHAAEEPSGAGHRARSGAIARVAGRLIRAFRTRS